MEFVRRIAVNDLVDCKGRVVEDVIGPTGAVLLPKGTEVRWFQKSLPAIIQRLLDAGVTHVAVQDEVEISQTELERILAVIDPHPVRQVDKVIAAKTMQQVGDVYKRIASGHVTTDDMVPLIDTGKALAREIIKTPQILHSLGKVKDWDEYTYVHSLNVALLTGFLMLRVQPDRHDLVEAVAGAALLHDLGKARVALSILNKPGKLSSDEYDAMKMHPVYGYEMANQAGIRDESILAVIRFHHERWHGDGYPDKLSGKDIPLVARVAAVADVFDALTTTRVYRECMPRTQALSLIVEGGGTHFDPVVIRELLLVLGLYPPGSVVELSDSSIGTVVAAKENDLLRPMVLIQVEGSGKPVKGVRILDIASASGIFIRKAIGDLEKRAL